MRWLKKVNMEKREQEIKYLNSVVLNDFDHGSWY